MSSAPTPQDIARDARWLAQALDPDAGVVRMIAMDEAAYRQASFLDDRMLQQQVVAELLPWATAADAASTVARRDARWVFHIGHVGSTLLARLLGELPGVLSVREPRLLRDLAALPPDRREPYAQPAQSLFSRTFRANQVALVKATSFVSEIAPELVSPRGAALFMYATPRNYVASILAGENSLKELRILAATRQQRLASRGIALPAPRHEADLAAAAWASEMTALEAAADAIPGSAWLDFDEMLKDVERTLATSAEALGFPAEVARIHDIATGPLMRRYSKALEYDYSPALRRDLIADATGRHARAIDDALAMLRSAAETSPLLARALVRAGEA